MWCTCVFVCMFSRVMHAQPCCWSDLGTWSCSSPASVRLLDLALFPLIQCTHPLASEKKESMMIKDTHYLFSLLGLLCAQTSMSWYDQNMLNSYLLTSLFYLHCSFQIKLPSILKKAQIVYSSWNLFCLLFICCKLTFNRTVNEEELVLFHWRLIQTLHWAVERKGCSCAGGMMRWRTWKTLRSYNDPLTVFLFPGLWPLVPTSWRGLFSLHWRNLSPQAHLKWSEMA